MHAYVQMYIYVLFVKDPPSLTQSCGLWYLRQLTFWPEHHWEERKLKVSARHPTNITSPSNNEPGRARFCPPCSNETQPLSSEVKELQHVGSFYDYKITSDLKLFSGTRCRGILKREHPMYLTCRDPTSGKCGCNAFYSNRHSYTIHEMCVLELPTLTYLSSLDFYDMLHFHSYLVPSCYRGYSK